MSSTVETTGRPGLRRVIDKVIKILGKEWLYIGESLFFLKINPPSFKVVYISSYFSLGIGIFLAFINLILGIVSLSCFHPKKDRRSSFKSILSFLD